MGRDRDVPLSMKRKRHFSDDDVCKYYLCGLSPYLLFKNTKSDLAKTSSYRKVQDEQMKAEWDKLSQSEKDKYGYEHDLLELLQSMVKDMDDRIARQKARLEQERAAEFRSVVEKLKSLSPADRIELRKIIADMGELDRKIRSMASELNTSTNDDDNNEDGDDNEETDESGSVDRIVDAMKRMNVLRQRRSAIEAKLDRGKGAMTASEKRKAQLVCEVSGCIMSTVDSGGRLRAHFEGKQYQGWKAIRAMCKKLQRQNPPRAMPGYGSSNDSRRRHDRREYRRQRDRRDRRRDRSRSRSRSRSWERRRRWRH